MALVAYENSDSSDFEDEDLETSTVVPLDKKLEDIPETKPSLATQNSSEPSDSHNLFNHLPQPKNKKPAVIEEDDEFLHKKETVTDIIKPKAKITVPSLNDFKDVEVPIARPKATNGKKSGLLSMLPQPKHTVTATTKSLIPNVLTQKPSVSNVKKKQIGNTTKKIKQETKALAIDYSDESDNEDIQNDFFSFNKPVEVPSVDDLPLELEPEISKTAQPVNPAQPRGIESYFKKEEVENGTHSHPGYEESNAVSVNYDNVGAGSSNSYVHEAMDQTSNGDVVLDDEAIRQLCGARGKRKREEIQIVDVNQQEVLADAREWLLKGLMDDTSKRVSSSKKRGNEPTTQQRRKHQITYLAHQAKANETELQNQWANNRQSKRQTQSKYGF